MEVTLFFVIGLPLVAPVSLYHQKRKHILCSLTCPNKPTPSPASGVFRPQKTKPEMFPK